MPRRHAGGRTSGRGAEFSWTRDQRTICPAFHPRAHAAPGRRPDHVMSRLPKLAVLVVLTLVLWGYIVGPLVGTFQRSITGASPVSDYLRFFDFRDSVEGEAMLGSLLIS